MDVTDENSVRSSVEEAVEAFGGMDIVHADADAVRFGADTVRRPLGRELTGRGVHAALEPRRP
ncbi:hypothetical protein ACFCYB_27485 [Streptomyces sp. NPDC056309]|uniref:hypothetical protein n=1 Tax=unclassified Streptomyces TaxID=2593676 RepID=UPI0035E2E7E8